MNRAKITVRLKAWCSMMVHTARGPNGPLRVRELLHQRVLERPLLPMVDRAERHARQRHGWRAIGSQATQFILQQVLPARPAVPARSHPKMVTP